METLLLGRVGAAMSSRTIGVSLNIEVPSVVLRDLVGRGFASVRSHTDAQLTVKKRF